jgi:hypothetical protein
MTPQGEAVMILPASIKGNGNYWQQPLFVL